MDTAEEVFDVLRASFGIDERQRTSFLEAWKVKRPWQFSGTVACDGADNRNVSGTLKPNPHRWKVVLAPECFSVTKGAVEWGAVQHAVNRAIRNILERGA